MLQEETANHVNRGVFINIKFLQSNYGQLYDDDLSTGLYHQGIHRANVRQERYHKTQRMMRDALSGKLKPTSVCVCMCVCVCVCVRANHTLGSYVMLLWSPDIG